MSACRASRSSAAPAPSPSPPPPDPFAFDDVAEERKEQPVRPPPPPVRSRRASTAANTIAARAVSQQEEQMKKGNGRQEARSPPSAARGARASAFAPSPPPARRSTAAPSAASRRRSAVSYKEEDSEAEEEEEEEEEEAERKESPRTPKRTPAQPRSMLSSLVSASKKRPAPTPEPASAKKPRTAAAPPSSSSRRPQPPRSGKSTFASPSPPPLPSATPSRCVGRTPSQKKKKTILDLAEEAAEAPKDDVCAICLDGGILTVCDHCVHAYHQGCLTTHHPDNYEVLKELGDDDPLFCSLVHMKCTTRKNTRKVQLEETTAAAEEEEEESVKVRWMGARTHVSNGRRYFKAFRRGADVFKVGSFVLLKNEEEEEEAGSKKVPSSSPHPDYVAEIESMWEEESGDKMIECRWLYLPEETRTGRLPSHSADEVFETAHIDDNEVDAIQDLCEVVDYEEYQRRIREEEERGITPQERAEKRRLFFVRQRYDDDRGEFRPLVRGRTVGANTGAALKERAVNPKQALAGLNSAVKSKQKNQSIYSQACAQLQLSAAPPRLPCRDKERDQIFRFLENGIKRGVADGGLYIAGVPGTGKTATVVRVISELAQRSDLPNFEYVEINGMKLPEPHQLYTALWKSLTGKHASPAKAAMYLDQRFRTNNLRRPICVLLVDELDYIMTRQQNVIYNLFDWPGRRSSRLLVIGISNTIDLPDLLMPRVHSRLGLTKIHFEPYNTEQIREIIQERLRVLPAFGEDAIELCARKIASVSGDIRRALQICRRAAEICEEDLAREQAAKLTAKGTKKALFGATAPPPLPSSTFGLAPSPSPSSLSSIDHMIGESHIVRAISDLQNSNFIQYLRCSATDFDKVLLCGMLASIKYAAGAAGGQAMMGGGEENPHIPLATLVVHAERIMDVKGIRKRLADASGVKVELYPQADLHQWQHIVQQWADIQLVHLSYSRGERWPAIQLQMLTEDIEHAFRGDDMWDRLRAQ